MSLAAGGVFEKGAKLSPFWLFLPVARALKGDNLAPFIALASAGGWL